MFEKLEVRRKKKDEKKNMTETWQIISKLIFFFRDFEMENHCKRICSNYDQEQ